MKKNYSFLIGLLVVIISLYAGVAVAQCTYTGLNANYCVNSPTSVLTPSVPGGTFSGPGVNGASFNPAIAGPGTHSISYSFCSPTYSITSETFSPMPMVGSAVILSDDAVSGGLPIGFNFSFFCNSFNTFYICSNGWLTFNAGMPATYPGQVMPNGANPNNIIAFAWTDLNPSSGNQGTITYTTLGVAPNRKLVVSFDQVHHYSSGTPVTVQTILYETTNIIEIHTTTMPTNGNNHTMGIEDGGGSNAYVVPGRNATTNWSATNECYRFTPGTSCSDTQTTTVSPSTISVVGSNMICTGNSTTLTATGNNTYTWTVPASNSPSVVVTPNSTTTYSVSGTNGFGCIADAAVTVTVFPGLPVLAVTSTTNSACLGQSVTLNATGAVTYTWTGGVTNGVPFAPPVTSGYTVTGSNPCGNATAATSIAVGPLPVTAASSPTRICAGFPSTLNAVTAATQFSWEPGSLSSQSIIVAPNVTTIYTISVSDGTCFGMTTLTLEADPVPTVNVAASTSVVCAGQPVYMTASGAMNYTWMPGNLSSPAVTVFPSGPTLYTVSGSNVFGCKTTTTQIVVTDPSPLVNVTSNASLVCSGDLVNLTASGNAAGYSWTNGPATPGHTVTPLVTTVYTVTGSSSQNTCTTTKTIQVNVFIISFSVSSSASVICAGQTVNLTASGADDYLWDNIQGGPFINVNPNSTTVYTVVANSTATTGLNCSDSKTIQVAVNPNPTVTASSSRTLICREESTELFGSGAQTYSWSTGVQAPSITVSPTIVTIHTYTVYGSDANNCSGSSLFQVRVIPCTAIGEQSGIGEIAVYPNPSSGYFVVEGISDANFSIINELGQTLGNYELNVSNGYKVKVSGLKPGIYFMLGESNQLRHKLIVE